MSEKLFCDLSSDRTQERALVGEVGATLPDGVKLEYEARYAAMLSHAIKNYALLTYSGEVIVRGAAMRSSRSEPYGERFLRQALRCVMQGDLVGVEQGYQETLRVLRTRSLPASDVATRFRLSKDAQTYLAGRARQKEAQYEALLLAGRRQWKSGEHVRFYRASNVSIAPKNSSKVPLKKSPGLGNFRLALSSAS
ncbi:hypothetical protein KSC_024800 [Ktedonobacter sp. SOSP1-52]|uniref:hypothetical protein n=1 Tax=Ktedonobacter sp. SOSP1-52 TaxID=2778366 RepID=UPI001A2E8C7E|nr:hypothetical protein [Ktedonobacter sp. SOSP1-52]GHO63588.1 hypothetical protein KSC_024800 [Ktedonobacter sp. SOSP1-52]